MFILISISFCLIDLRCRELQKMQSKLGKILALPVDTTSCRKSERNFLISLAQMRKIIKFHTIESTIENVMASIEATSAL